MSRFWGRSTEASSSQLAATGAGFGAVDPIDGDTGYVRLGEAPGDVPAVTLEKARRYSLNAYRSNPMAGAILDTYISFAVGDSGLTYQCASDEVRPIVEAFWTDPAVRLPTISRLLLQSHMLDGESLFDLIVGQTSGITRLSIVNPSRIVDIELKDGNPLWHSKAIIKDGFDRRPIDLVTVNDMTGLREGRALFFPSWRARAYDRRGMPFLTRIMDQLDAYDQVLSNLVDRTALMRHLAYQVTIAGADQAEIDRIIKQRGGTHAPKSGTVEFTNEKVKWDAISAQTGSYEDSNTSTLLLTSIASGAGLARTWLADSEGANRATSLSMAEPVRRRVAGVQSEWLGFMTEIVRFAVDQAVAARRIPAFVDSTTDGTTARVPASTTVRVTGPEIAAADADVTAGVLLKLAQALDLMKRSGALTDEALKIAAQKGWEQFTRQPFRADLMNTNTDPATLADAVDESSRLRAV